MSQTLTHASNGHPVAANLLDQCQIDKSPRQMLVERQVDERFRELETKLRSDLGLPARQYLDEEEGE